MDMIFNLFNELKVQHTGTILDCLFTLGKEIAGTGSQALISYYMDKHNAQALGQV